MDPTRRLARVTAERHRAAGRRSRASPTPRRSCWPPSRSAPPTRCLELTVEYTKERVQFGRPIGSFQALKHRMADLYVAVQTARRRRRRARRTTRRRPSAALARVAATEAFCDVAAEAIQMHGGIAITWEHDIQLYFKRAHGSAQLLGPPREHLRRLENPRCSQPT